MKKFLVLSLLDGVFIMLINVKMPIIIDILTFISRINCVLSRVEHGKKVYNLVARIPPSGPCRINEFEHEIYPANKC